MNANNFKQCKTDYLAFMAPPNGTAASIRVSESDQMRQSLGDKFVCVTHTIALINLITQFFLLIYR